MSNQQLLKNLAKVSLLFSFFVIFMVSTCYKIPLLIPEMIAEYNKDWPMKKKLEELMKALQEKAEETNKEFAVFIDEMPPSFFEENPDNKSFFKALHDEYHSVHVFMAISPSGKNLTKAIDVKFGDGDNKIFCRQLRSRHRNSFLLSNFLVHLTYKYNKLKQTDSKFQCLSPVHDVPLDASNLPDG